MTWSLEPVPPELQMQRHPYAGRVRWRGLDVLVENPKGTVRHGDGWQTKMGAHYGEIAGTLGLDGEPVDVYLGPTPDAAQVYVVRQKMPGEKTVDELKVMVGFPTREAALRAFREHYDRSGFFHSCVSMPVDKFVEIIGTWSAPGIMAKATVQVPAHVRQTPSGQVQVPAYTYERQGVAASVPAVHEAHAALPEQEQRRRYFTDRNTGLLNARGAEAQPHDAGRPMTARFSAEGFKSLNDNFGHHVADGALRHMAHELAQHMPDGVKRGGDIEGDVRDQGHADAIAERMSRRIDPQGRVKVTATAVPRSENHEETLGRLGNAHRDRKDARVQAGEIGHRLHAPKAFQGHANPAEAMKPLAEHLASAPVRPTSTMSTHHAAAFGKVGADKAFDQSHLEDTGLLTDDGFARSHEMNPDHHVASADMRGLQGINDAFGREAADEILKTFSTLVHEAGGGEVHAAHPHGDEYLAHHQDPQKLRQFFGALKAASDRVAFVQEKPDGIMVQTGLHFVHGVGKDLDEADRVDLARNKRAQGDVPGPRLIADQDEAARHLGELRGRGVRIVRLGQGAPGGVRQGDEGQPGQAEPVEPLAKGSRFVLRFDLAPWKRTWMEMAEQLGLFGAKAPTKEVEVKAHIRKDTKTGEFVMVAAHTSHHAVAEPEPETHAQRLQRLTLEWFHNGTRILEDAKAQLRTEAVKVIDREMESYAKRGIVHDPNATRAAFVWGAQAVADMEIAQEVLGSVTGAKLDYERGPAANAIRTIARSIDTDVLDMEGAKLGWEPLAKVYALDGNAKGRARAQTLRSHLLAHVAAADTPEEMMNRLEALQSRTGGAPPAGWSLGLRRGLGVGVKRGDVAMYDALMEREAPELFVNMRAHIAALAGEQHARATLDTAAIEMAKTIKGKSYLGKGEDGYSDDPAYERDQDEEDDVIQRAYVLLTNSAGRMSSATSTWDLRKQVRRIVDVGGAVRLTQLDSPVPGLRGRHWGSVADDRGKITNVTAIGVAVVGDDGWLRNPATGMQSETPEPLGELAKWQAEGRFVYAQHRLAQTKETTIFRGMMLPESIVVHMAAKIARDRAGRLDLPLTGCTAFSFDRDVAEKYADSAWTAAMHNRSSRSEPGASVLLHIDRTPDVDRTIAMAHDHFSGTKFPPFEILTAAKRLSIRAIRKEGHVYHMYGEVSADE